MVWGKNNALWERNYAAAKEYYEKHGDLEVPPQYVSDNGIWLGRWLSSQRKLYIEGKLDKDKADKLSSIGMRWHNAYDIKWDAAYKRAVEYYNTHGNLEISLDYATADGFRLGIWLRTQRKKYRTGKLDKEQTKKLEQLGVAWNVGKDSWQQGYTILCKYRKKYGSCAVKSDYVTDDGYRLGSWVNNQRTGYKKGRLSDEHIRLLEEIGFVWDPSRTQWQMKLDSARRYYEANGSIRVPVTYVTDTGYKLNSWINDQRKAYKRGKLNTEQVEQLREIGIV